MNYSAIAVRYSKALFSLATDKGKLKEVQKDVVLIKSVCETEADFKNFLDFPVIKVSKKISVFSEIFGDKIDPLTMEFLKLIVNNKREPYLLSICFAFLHLYKEEQGIKTLHFTSAEKIDENVKAKIINIVKNHYKAEIELEEKTNKDLIGGFILRVNDEQFDASVATHLKRIEKELINN